MKEYISFIFIDLSGGSGQADFDKFLNDGWKIQTAFTTATSIMYILEREKSDVPDLTATASSSMMIISNGKKVKP